MVYNPDEVEADWYLDPDKPEHLNNIDIKDRYG